MATPTDQGLVMTHPDLPGRTITVPNQKVAAVHALAGWVIGAAKKTPANKKEG